MSTAPASDPLFDRLAAGLAGEYRLERELGRGGMGVVYRAHDLRLDRAVAIKVLPPALADATDATGLRARFLREARTAARLSHPHIVPVYRAAEVDGLAYFVMAFVDGASFEEILAAHGALGAAEVVPIVRDAALALGHAHARGVVHRDVKPANILVERDTGRVLLTDFGIAHAIASAETTASGTPATPLTQSGQVLGTVHYLSPEQAAGEPLDGRSDLYALGVVAYRALSGRVPFDGPAAAVLVAHLTRPAPALGDVAPGVPAHVAAVVDRCLQKEPAARYATGEALAAALTQGLMPAIADIPSDPGAGPAHTLRERTPEHAPRGGPAERPLARLSTAAALDVWGRAAAMQAAITGVQTPVDPAVITPAPAESVRDAATTGYSVPEVADAAEAAGISRRYVALALAERASAGDAANEFGDAPPVLGGDRTAAVMLGSARRRVRAARVLDAPLERVLAAMGAVLQAAPFDLLLGDAVGGAPRDGGVLVFDLRGFGAAMPARGGLAQLRFGVGARQLLATLTPVPSPSGAPGGACEVALQADVTPGRGHNVATALAWDALSGMLGGGAGWMVGFKVAAVGAAMAGWMTGLGAVGLLAGAVGYRAVFRDALTKAEGELAHALDAVAASLRAKAVFGDGAAAPLARRAPDRDDDRSDDVIVPLI